MREINENMRIKHEDHLILLDQLKAAIREVLREELASLLGDAEPAGDRMLGVWEAAQHLGLSTSTVYKLAQRCELPSVKAGSRVLFRVPDLDAYAEARRRSPERVKALAAEALERP